MPITTESGSAAHLRAYSDAVKAIQSDDSLSDVGRRRSIARAWVAAQTGAESDRNRTAAVRDRAAAAHEAVLFRRTATDPAFRVAQRDAADRASQIGTVAEAATMLARAERSGDEELARAIMAVAWERTSALTPQWGDVVDAYLSTRPTERAAADALCELTRGEPTATERLSEQLPIPAGFRSRAEVETEAAAGAPGSRDEQSPAAAAADEWSQVFSRAGGNG